MLPSSGRTAASVEKFFQYSLLGLVASGYFALAGSGALDRPTLILTFLGLLARTARVAGIVHFEITPRMASYAALGYIAFYPVDFYLLSQDFLSATVHTVCFLAVIKILTARTNRDFAYTGVISFVELVAGALLSIESSFFAFLALYIVFAIATFTSAEIRRSLGRHAPAPSHTAPRIGWRLAAIAVGATAGILVITAGLFLMVPRTARVAAFLFPNAPRLTGFSNVIDLGGFGKIAKDNRAVLHILSYSRTFPRNMKWRGTALSAFDGRRWFEPALPGREVLTAKGSAMVTDEYQRSRRDGGRLLYRVDMQHADTRTLFIAGIPEFVNIDRPRLVVTPEDAIRVTGAPSETLRYEVSAHTGPPIPWLLTRAERARYLQLPPIDARIWTTARQWAGTGTQMERALRIQQKLQRGYKYVLEGPERGTKDPLAEFLFVRKAGYCEYFASAMAVMLRSIGIPARVATGFQSGFYNEVSGMYVMRASDAHAWVEGWIPGLGWATFDPTPPARGGPPLAASLLERINMYLDAADQTWQQWVVAYDIGRQIEVAARFETALRNWSRPTPGAAQGWSGWLGGSWKGRSGWAAGFLVLVAALWFVRKRFWPEWRRAARIRRIVREGCQPKEAAVLYAAMLEFLARRGYAKSASSTALEFARQLPANEKPRIEAFTELYQAVRFGGDAAGVARLAQLLEELRQPVRASARI